MPSLKNCAGMIPTLALPGREDAGAVGPHQARPAAAQVVVDAQLVVRGDALRDRDDQLDAGVLGLEDRVGGEARRHEDHRRVGAGLGHRGVEGVEDRDAVHVLAALAGRNARDDLGAVVAVAKRVERALAPGDAGDAEARVGVDEDGHQQRQLHDALGGAEHRRLGVHVRQVRLGQQARGPPSSLVPSSRTTNGTSGSIWRKASIRPLRHLVAARDAAEDVEQHGAHLLVREDHLDRARDRLRLRAAAGVEEVGGPPAGLSHHVERGHHEPGAVAEDADVAVELHVGEPALLCHPLLWILRRQVAQLGHVGVAEEGVGVDRDLGVERNRPRASSVTSSGLTSTSVASSSDEDLVEPARASRRPAGSRPPRCPPRTPAGARGSPGSRSAGPRAACRIACGSVSATSSTSMPPMRESIAIGFLRRAVEHDCRVVLLGDARRPSPRTARGP